MKEKNLTEKKFKKKMEKRVWGKNSITINQKDKIHFKLITLSIITTYKESKEKKKNWRKIRVKKKTPSQSTEKKKLKSILNLNLGERNHFVNYHE